MTIRVLVVDDSAVVRLTLQNVLSREPGIEVVGTAPDPFVARDKIAELEPDVMTLDIEMPGMDGITFLRKVMRFHPLPVVVISSYTVDGSKLAFEALDAGAVDIVPKPGPGFPLAEMSMQLVDKVREAALARLQVVSDSSSGIRLKRLTEPLLRGGEGKVIAIGASTGGTKAIEELLTTFPRNAPGTVIVQHMPANFTRSFAERLNKVCTVEVREANNGDHVKPGVALIAPGNRHMLVQRDGEGLIVKIKDGPRIHKHRPSVEILFKSVAMTVGGNALGVLLTGMGIDGASGLLEMRGQGAHTIAQDEATCVVYGMPSAAVKKDAAVEVLPLTKITASLMAHAAG